MNDWTDDETRQIIVGFDSDWQSRQWLLDRAAQEAERRKAALTLLTVRPHRGGPVPAPPVDPSGRPAAAGTDDGFPSEAVAALRLMYPVLSIRGLCLDAAELSQDTPALRGAELLVIGSRGRFDQPAFASGSMSQILLAALSCPVLLIPATVEHRSENSWRENERFVLVGIGADFDDLQVARASLDEAARHGCDLHLLFSHEAMSGPLEESELSRPWDLVRAAAAGPGDSTTHLSVILTSEKPAEALLHHAVDATVVVVGSRPGSLVGLVRDSVSHAVLTSVRCPVLVVPRDVASPTSSDGSLVTAGHFRRL